jgi:sugar lactone lactonase YvrE
MGIGEWGMANPMPFPFPIPDSPFPLFRCPARPGRLQGGGRRASHPQAHSAPEPVSATATLAIDSAGRVWVGDAGRLTVLDTLGRVAARIPVPGPPRAC